MTSILDIAPSTRTVKTSRGDLAVSGLGLDGIVHLLREHPELAEFFKGGKPSLSGELHELLEMGLEVVAAFMAAGLGFPGNKDAEQKCREFNPEDAWNICEAIIQESFPNGITSFFSKLEQLPILERVPATSPEAPPATA